MRGTYAETCAFLTGYEQGSGLFVLKTFHDWLVPRRKGRHELYRPLLVLCEIYDDGALPDIQSFSPEQDELAIGTLFSLLEEFFETLPGRTAKSPGG